MPGVSLRQPFPKEADASVSAASLANRPTDRTAPRRGGLGDMLEIEGVFRTKEPRAYEKRMSKKRGKFPARA